MGRNPKEGLDYFLLDCALDDKFRLVEAEFGLTGFGVVVKLLQKIYGQCGYYVEWTNEVALLFAADCRLGGSVVSEIVSASIKRGIFDGEIFEKYLVLTSKGIQKRYLEAVKRRKILTLTKQYLLVDVAQILDNDNINVIYVYINQENVCNNPQSRVEKSKVKKSKEDIGGKPPKPLKKKFEPPTSEEVKAYCVERGKGVDGQKVWDYYNAMEWVDTNGKPVERWKGKVISVWEKDNASKQQKTNTNSKSPSYDISEIENLIEKEGIF